VEIIVSHVNADFDSIAAMVAAQKIYPRAKLVFAGSQNRNVREFLALHQDIIHFLDLKYLDKKEVKRLIVVDTRIADRLGDLEDVTYQKGVEIFTFDHHPPSPDDMEISRDFSEPTGAATTMLVKILRDRRISISPFEATLFALGIHEDTGSLTFPTSTYEDAEALAFLMANGANIDMIDRFLNQPLTPEQRELLDELLKSIYIENINGVKVMFTSARAKTYVDGASVVTRKIADLENINVIFSLIATEDRVYIIGRSKLDEVPIGEILTRFEGGGHPQAGSAVIKGSNLDKTRKTLHAELFTYIKNPLTAGDIMTKSVVSVDPDTPLVKAREVLNKHGYTGLPVMDKKKLVGMISKHDIDKTAHHGLSHAPVKGFMSYKVKTIAKNMTLDLIERIFTEANMGRLPVIEQGRMIGIVSRSDLLRATHGFEYLIEPRKIRAPSRRINREEVVQKIKTTLPLDVRRLLRSVGQTAEKNGFKVYLVGGIVRDLLMGQQNLDIDVVLDRDGIAFGKVFIEKQGGRLVAHKKFGTAVAVLPNGCRIDIATARSESYEHPAALPKVEFTSIGRDLARRDFALNAMAIALNTPKFGSLLDFFGGQKDIQDGIIRVLHDLSFVEDPTRIFRAVRFEQRYGFQMDGYTENLARQAIDMDLVGRLTSVRVRDELVLILIEDSAWSALKRLSDLGALANLQPEVVRIDARLQSLFKSIQNTVPRLNYYYARKSGRWLLFLMALLRNLSEQKLDEWCNQMRFKKADVQILKEGVLKTPVVLKKLRSASKLKNSTLYSILNPLAQESIEYIYARSSQRLVRQRIDFYLANLKDIKLNINGNDLLESGFKASPLFSEVLGKLLVAKLNGLVRSKSEELTFARELLEKGN